MSFFNFYKNYKKAKELDQLKSSLESAEKYLSYRIIKGPSTSECHILKMYAEYAMIHEDCRRLFLKQKEIYDMNRAVVLENLSLKRDKLKAEIKLLEQTLKQNGKRD